LKVEALSYASLQEIDFHKTDVKNNYLSFSYVVDGKVISFGTVLFTKPKHFHFVDPKLEFSVNGDEITVKASAFARYVYIYNKNDDLILSDNFFDMNKGKKTVKIISGEAKDLAVKTVFDINKNN
jgi:beta-mannosidase